MTERAKTVGAAEAASDPKMTKRQLQAMQTKDKIYSAAVREINEKGFSNVNVEDITMAANVAKGSFYTHFESKEALIFYTFQQSDEIYKRAYRRVKGKDFLSMVTQFVSISYIEYEKRGKGIIKAIISNYFTMPGEIYGETRPLLKYLADIVESGKAQGVLNAEEPTDRYVSLLLSAMVGVEVMWCFDREGRSLAEMMEAAVRVTATGMTRGSVQ